MQHKMFCIYDQKAEAYLTPFFLPNENMAIRTFSDCVNSENHQFGKHPGDYSLIHLGTWDDQGAEIVQEPVPKVLGSGLEYKEHTINGE